MKESKNHYQLVLVLNPETKTDSLLPYLDES